MASSAYFSRFSISLDSRVLGMAGPCRRHSRGHPLPSRYPFAGFAGSFSGTSVSAASVRGGGSSPRRMRRPRCRLRRCAPVRQMALPVAVIDVNKKTASENHRRHLVSRATVYFRAAFAKFIVRFVSSPYDLGSYRGGGNRPAMFSGFWLLISPLADEYLCGFF